MNIFYLHHSPKICAQQHVKSHLTKMPTELAQILSTCHRVLDGKKIVTKSFHTGRKMTYYIHPEPLMESLLYKATHVNHPSVQWCMKCADNYRWTYELYTELLNEFIYRRGKEHGCSKLIHVLAKLPYNISTLEKFSQPTPAMDKKYIVSNDSVENYQYYYRTGKVHLHNWENREVPEWVQL